MADSPGAGGAGAAPRDHQQPPSTPPLMGLSIKRPSLAPPPSELHVHEYSTPKVAAPQCVRAGLRRLASLASLHSALDGGAHWAGAPTGSGEGSGGDSPGAASPASRRMPVAGWGDAASPPRGAGSVGGGSPRSTSSAGGGAAVPAIVTVSSRRLVAAPSLDALASHRSGGAVPSSPLVEAMGGGFRPRGEAPHSGGGGGAHNGAHHPPLHPPVAASRAASRPDETAQAAGSPVALARRAAAAGGGGGARDRQGSGFIPSLLASPARGGGAHLGSPLSRSASTAHSVGSSGGGSTRQLLFGADHDREDARGEGARLSIRAPDDAGASDADAPTSAGTGNGGASTSGASASGSASSGAWLSPPGGGDGAPSPGYVLHTCATSGQVLAVGSDVLQQDVVVDHHAVHPQPHPHDAHDDDDDDGSGSGGDSDPEDRVAAAFLASVDHHDAHERHHSGGDGGGAVVDHAAPPRGAGGGRRMSIRQAAAAVELAAAAVEATERGLDDLPGAPPPRAADSSASASPTVGREAASREGGGVAAELQAASAPHPPVRGGRRRSMSAPLLALPAGSGGNDGPGQPPPLDAAAAATAAQPAGPSGALSPLHEHDHSVAGVHHNHHAASAPRRPVSEGGGGAADGDGGSARLHAAVAPDADAEHAPVHAHAHAHHHHHHAHSAAAAEADAQLQRLFTVHYPSPADPLTVPAQVVPGLWLGGWAAAGDAGFLARARIQEIVNCAGKHDVTPAMVAAQQGAGVRHVHYLDLEDVEAFDARVSFYIGAQLVAAALAAGHCVLVHCAQGVSRSVSVVASFLVRYRGLSLLQALCVVKAARKFA